MVQPEGGGHYDGGIARLRRMILGVVMFLIGIRVSGIGFGIAANRDGRDLTELGGGGGGIMIEDGGRWFGHGTGGKRFFPVTV